MPGTFFGVEIARRGINVHRAAMDVTGHNMANANTPGYSRQAAVIQASDPWTIPNLATSLQPGQLGTGAQVEQVRRIRDYYLDVQYRQAGSYEGYWQQKLDFSQRIETVFPEPDGQGIQAGLLDFFNDWQDLNNDPQNSGVKAAVKESGDELAATIRQTYSQLVGIGESITGAINDQVDHANKLLTEIADVSNAIIFTIKNGAQPNDLLDQRDQLLDQLAALGPINVDVQDNGMITVNFINSTTTVLQDDGTGKVTASQLALSTGAGPGGDENHLSVDGVDVINLTGLADYYTGAPEGAGMGAILGNESARLGNKDLLERLDNLAVAIIDNINNKSGLTFFTGAGAADIALDSGVKNNCDSIIGENALTVAQLQSTPVTIGTATATFENYYQSMVAQVGANVEKADRMLDNQQAISQQIDSLRQSVSGVSLDEELTMVIQINYGYQASARMLSMQDEMLDYLINRIV